MTSKNQDSFEETLRRQPVRQIPADWRQETLAAASAARRSATGQESRGRRITGLRMKVRELLWPAPQAWGAIAAVWVGLWVFNYSHADQMTPSMRTTASAAPAMISGFREQQRLLAELSHPAEAPKRAAPKPAPQRPRSERQKTLFAV